MNSQVRMLNNEEIQSISGGHGGSGMIMLLLGIPHIIIGIIEFTNYFGERIAKGCDDIEGNDYFAKGMCNAYKSVTGLVSR